MVQQSIMFDETMKEILKKIKSGDYDLAAEAVKQVHAAANPELYRKLLAGTYVDLSGILWVGPHLVNPPQQQQPCDYAVWNLIALCPADILEDIGIRKDEIESIYFRLYSNTLDDAECETNYFAYQQSDPRQPSVLRRLPEEIYRLPGLKKIDASKTRINEIPASIVKCKSLISLNIQNGFFESLPDSIGHLEKLENLNLHGNRLINLPKSFNKLQNLNSLTLSKNNLSGIPQVIECLPNLAFLTLAANKITELTDPLFSCTGLLWLDISKNQYNELPSGFGRLHQLHRLICSDNHLLKSVATELTTLENLDFIDFDRCRSLSPGPLHRRLISREQVEEYFSEILAFANSAKSNKPNLITRQRGKVSVPEIPKPVVESNSDSPQVAMLMQMLQSKDLSHFTAALRLIYGYKNPELAFHCLKNLPIINRNRNGVVDFFFDLKTDFCSVLFDFLLRSDFPSSPELDLIKSQVTQLDISGSTPLIHRVHEVFPVLRYLTLNFKGESSDFRFDGLSGVKNFIIDGFTGKQKLVFGEHLKRCSQLTFGNCQFAGKVIIESCPDLEVLEISDSYISSLEIKNCPKLKEIMSGSDFLSSIPKAETEFQLIDCPELEAISVPIWKLRSMTISGCPMLLQVEFNSKILQPDSVKVSNVPQLKILKINNQGLKFFPNFISTVPSLEMLDLSYNQLVYLPYEMAALQNLAELNLTANRFVRCPEVIHELKNLEKLCLGWQTTSSPGSSTIRELDSKLGELPKLQKLEIMMPEKAIRKSAYHFKKSKTRFLSPYGDKYRKRK